MGLVVFIVPAGAKVHLRRNDTMWRRSSTQGPGRHVVCFVVLVVVARGDFWALGTGVASGQVLFHVQPPSVGARLGAERSPLLLSARLKTGAMVAVVVSGFVNDRGATGEMM